MRIGRSDSTLKDGSGQPSRNGRWNSFLSRDLTARERWRLLISGPAADRGAAVAILAMMIAFSFAPLLNAALNKTHNKDYDLWQRTGQLLLDGGEIYPRTGEPLPFMYPPPCAVMLAPISPLPRWAFVLALVLLNSAAWAASIFLSVFLAAGNARGAPAALYLWPSLAVIPLVHNTYLLGQPALLLLALLLGSFAFLRREQPVCAGLLIALATAIKAFPLLAAGYLVYRRKWRALAALGGGLLFLLFLFPLVFRTPPQVKDDFVVWAGGMLFKYDETSISQRPERSYSFKNQSVAAVVHRLVRSIPANGEADPTWKVNLFDLSFRQATWVMVAAISGLLVFFLAATWGCPGPLLPDDAVEQGMVTLLVLFLAPLSFAYNYVWLLFPITILLHHGFSPASGPRLRRLCWGALAGALFLLSLSIPFLLQAAAYGNLFFAGLLLMGALGVMARRSWLDNPRQP